jgi:hypothetical protein
MHRRTGSSVQFEYTLVCMPLGQIMKDIVVLMSLPSAINFSGPYHFDRFTVRSSSSPECIEGRDDAAGY